MKNISQLPLLIVAGLVFANFAAADTITDITAIESNTDLSAEIQALFGTSGIWTISDNIAALNELASLISGAGSDNSQLPGLLDPLLQLILDQENGSGAASMNSDPNLTDQLISDNPEPVTLVLLGGGLIVLAALAARSYARRRTDQPDGD